MSKDLEAIHEFLRRRNADFVSVVRMDPASNIVVLEVPIGSVRDTADHGFTSKRQLAYLSRDLSLETKTQVTVAFQESPEMATLEMALRSVLQAKFPEHVANLLMFSTTGTKAQPWVELRRETDDHVRAAIRAQIEEFLVGANIVSEGIEFVSPALPEPSLAAILRSLKTLSPAKPENLKEHLGNRGFFVPPDPWLTHRLDVARKHGLVIRTEMGSYVLTEGGLQAVPHSRLRTSSDIERVLLLGRRQKW